MKKWIFRVLGLLVLAALAVCILFFYQGYENASALEKTKPLDRLVEEQTSRPDYVPYDELPLFFTEATVSIEDARFYEHNGLDWIGLLRAGFSQFLPFLPRSGGSTISQQVVKNLYGQFNGGLEWKGSEMVLARKLEEMLSKDEILALYVNIINYGDGYEGIYEASWGYFQVAPSQLTDAESALLAGIPQSPANFQLSNHMEAAKAKQELVLQAMVENGYISEQQAQQTAAEPIWYYSGGIWNTFSYNLN